jgi:hypothetical protein
MLFEHRPTEAIDLHLCDYLHARSFESEFQPPDSGEQR